MAEKTMTLPRIPSALRRAKEAAEDEAKSNIQAQNPVETVRPSDQSEQGRAEAPQVATYQFTGFEKEVKPTRVTRTFTMEKETDIKLDEAARKFGVTKSAVLERAFNDWYELVNV